MKSYWVDRTVSGVIQSSPTMQVEIPLPKGEAKDPSTGQDVEVLYVKGSGGDLGTLKEAGLAGLYLDRMRALVNVYRGVEHEDEMVALFDYCTFGRGGAAPSIDTAMHGLVRCCSCGSPCIQIPSLHLLLLQMDQRSPKNVLEMKFSGLIGAVLVSNLVLILQKWLKRIRAAKGVILGGHGLTTWAQTSAECEKRSIEAIEKAEKFLAAKGKKDPFGTLVKEWAPLSPEARKAKAALLAPALRGIASMDAPMLGSFSDTDVVLDFISHSELTRLAALGTSCPDHFLRTKISPMVLDTPADASVEDVIARAHELHEKYRETYAAYYKKYAKPESPAMRGADPLIILVPGVGMFSYGKDKQTSRVAGEFYINAINVMRGAESVSTYKPIAESEKFNIEYWELEEAKLRRMPKPKPLAGRIAIVTGGGSGIGKATSLRLAAEGACVVVADRDLDAASAVAAEIGGPDKAIAVKVDVTDEEAIIATVHASSLAFGGVDLVVNNAGLSLSKALVDTTVADWDLQHDVMARGSFLMSRESAKAMIAQKMGGDIVYISSKNSIFAGPNNIAYGATKADQAHQVRLLAAELGAHQIRVNGVNPDGVVRGSGIFSSGWGANRAAVYGVEEEKLGEYYAQRSILKREVLPENIAAAVFVLCSSDLVLTTGLHIPVDSGVAAAFMR